MNVIVKFIYVICYNAYDAIKLCIKSWSIVDFWAPWCGPCVQMAPHFESAAIAMPLQAQFLKINNDDEQTLGSKLHIASIPAVLVFKEGKEIDRFTGARSSLQIQEWVKQYL